MTTVSWVFGYGSLMWDPGFCPAETVKARLTGYARRFCLRSTIYRGTEKEPGLVLGLDQQENAECAGLAMRVAAHEHTEVMTYLRAREMSTGAYHEAVLPLMLEDGRQVEALAYVMRRDHWQYAGDLAADEQARIIATACGGRGPNCDYLFNTASHLARVGLPDPDMEQLSATVRRLMTP